MDTGLDPHPEGFPLDLSLATVVPRRNIHNAHKEGQIPIPTVPIFGTGPNSRTGMRVRLCVCELAITVNRFAEILTSETE